MAGLAVLAAGQARGVDAAATRVALVIGNAAYPSGPLINPGNDAHAMAATLARIGFRVVELRDGSRSQMQGALTAACDRLQGRRGLGMGCDAGHGLHLDWRNFMLPAGAEPASAADLPRQALDLQPVTDAFQAAGNAMDIIVLDACRNNPFEGGSSGKGLAPLSAPSGSYFAYATAPGHVTDDGAAADGHGLYTRHLRDEIARPDAGIEAVFKRVRLKVRQASQSREVPWDMSSLEDDFAFATGQPQPRVAGAARDAAFEAERADWDRIKSSPRAEDFYAFLAKYPTGMLAELAPFRLDPLAQLSVHPAPALDAPPALPSGTRR
jgi:uncharacterized caspase-like protein